MNTRELNTFTTAELEAAIKKNQALCGELSELAYEEFTRFEIDDLFRHCPSCLEEDSYGRLMIARYHDTPSNWQDLLEWTAEVNGERCIYPAEFGAKIDKALHYIDVMRDDDCGYISMKPADYEKIQSYTENVVRDCIDFIQECYNELRERFNDAWTLADALLSYELLADYYQTEDGKIYKRRADKLIA